MAVDFIRAQDVRLLLNGVSIANISGLDFSFGCDLKKTPLLQTPNPHLDQSVISVELSFSELMVNPDTMALALGYSEFTDDGKIKVIDTSLASKVEGRQLDHTTDDVKTADSATGFTQDIAVQGDRIENIMLWCSSYVTGTAALKIENEDASDSVFIKATDLTGNQDKWYRYTLYNEAGCTTVGTLTLKETDIGATETLKFIVNTGATTYSFAGITGSHIAYVMLFQTDSHYSFEIKYRNQNGVVSFVLLISKCRFSKDSISATPGEPVIDDVSGFASEVEVLDASKY